MSEPCAENRNQYALAALKDRRSAVSGELADLERQARALRVTLAHIDAVLALFAPEVDPDALPVRVPRKASDFPVDHVTRRILGALRRHGEPMALGAVVDAVTLDMGYPPEAGPVIQYRIGHALRALSRAEAPLVCKEGFRGTARWRLV